MISSSYGRFSASAANETHSSQMQTFGPATTLRVSSRGFPQNEQIN